MAGYDISAQRQLQEQLQQLAQRQQIGANIGRSGTLVSIEKILSNLSDDKKEKIMSNKDFIEAKNNYTQGLLDYMMSFHQDNYANTIGKEAADNLLNELNKSIKIVEAQEKDNQLTMDALLKLAKEDPDIKSRINQVLTKKQ